MLLLAGIAVLPLDNPLFPRLRERAGTHRVIGFGSANLAEARLVDVQPDADGVIHYGVVSVQNNFLALSIRNRSRAGAVARPPFAIQARMRVRRGSPTSTRSIEMARPVSALTSTRAPHTRRSPPLTSYCTGSAVVM